MATREEMLKSLVSKAGKKQEKTGDQAGVALKRQGVSYVKSQAKSGR